MPLLSRSCNELLYYQLFQGSIDVVDYLPFLRHQAVACLIGKIQGQLRLFVGIYIAGIHNKISGRQHSHRISLTVHQRLVTAVNIDIVNSLNLCQGSGEGCPAENLPFRLHGCVIHVEVQIQHLFLLAAPLVGYPVRQAGLAVQILWHIQELVHQFIHQLPLILCFRLVLLGNQLGDGRIQIINQISALGRVGDRAFPLSAARQQEYNRHQRQYQPFHRMYSHGMSAPGMSAHGFASCLGT